ncbi:hypothetical protein [Nocardia vulneris]|uniref:Uncharacterized protein n=1 Tax=Nocardia vulneris TaxID=1141657 RepID=A0ABR4ZF74_9NOCA|nr:hypothetical protein [Nocardia vulneris]KIA64042.1 hypothetical protein FG87_15370 [Nocardia vulneris]
MSRPPHTDRAADASADDVTAAEELAYREQQRRTQYEAIHATSVALDDEEDPRMVLAELQVIRKEIADRRLRGG